MNLTNKRYLSLVIWIFSLITIGVIIGNLTKIDIGSWYATLNRSPLTPPNYVFGIVWSILYALLGVCGWAIWNNHIRQLKSIKIAYLSQLLLNWSWTPLFFRYHMTGFALICITLMVILVLCIILMTLRKIKIVSFLLTPYLLWLMFAIYLNLYIWLNN